MNAFDELFTEIARRPRGGRWEPNSDVFVDDAHRCVVVTVEVAGADADSIRIGVDQRHLFITGHRQDGVRGQHGTFTQKEIEYGDFIKRIHLPVAVTYSEVAATYRDGLLTIRLPIAVGEEMPLARTEIRMTIRRSVG